MTSHDMNKPCLICSTRELCLVYVYIIYELTCLRMYISYYIHIYQIMRHTCPLHAHPHQPHHQASAPFPSTRSRQPALPTAIVHGFGLCAGVPHSNSDWPVPSQGRCQTAINDAGSCPRVPKSINNWPPGFQPEPEPCQTAIVNGTGVGVPSSSSLTNQI